MKNNKSQTVNFRRGLLASAVMVGMGLSTAQALELDTGSEDLKIRFDNTIKLNYAQRVESANSKIANSWNTNDGDRNFSAGSAVSQRADVLTELDVVYKESMGFRVSANTWYDNAYNNTGNDNPSTNSFHDGQPDAGHQSGYYKRYLNGPSSEFLDAFVFGSMEVGEESLLSAKLGSTTSYWGEALFSTIHGNSFGQSGVDISKGLAVPGTEAKELFIPREQFQATLNLNSELTFAGQYFLGWDASRLPESGSYLSWSDSAQFGGHNLYAITGANPLGSGYLYSQNSHTYTPDDTGDFGLMAKWAPEWLDGTMGFYYRNTSDELPNSVITPRAAADREPIGGAAIVAGIGPQGAIASDYNLVYADDIDIYGFSLSKNVGATSVGFDLNYRENMPLFSISSVVDPALAAQGIPGYISSFSGNPQDEMIAKGKTLHAVLNGLMTFAEAPLWDSLSVATELQYSHLISVDKNKDLYRGEDFYRGIDKPTDNYYGMNINVTPTYFQVLPGMDMYLPMSLSQGIGGQSQVVRGGNEGAGSYSVGVAADFYNKYRFDLKYVDNFGDVETCDSAFDSATPGGTNNYACAKGQIASSAGPVALLKDRGMVTLTFKTTI